MKATKKDAAVIQPNAVYSLEQASSQLNISVQHLRRAVNDGFLLATRPGQHYLTTGEWLLNYVREPEKVKTP